jgi:hypothetical protein
MHGLVRQNFFTCDCREYRNDVNAAHLDWMPPKINEPVHCKKIKTTPFSPIIAGRGCDAHSKMDLLRAFAGICLFYPLFCLMMTMCVWPRVPEHDCEGFGCCIAKAEFRVIKHCARM